jgi:LuxR family transcriptional regulator, maltose regulon positive regulatory protein
VLLALANIHHEMADLPALRDMLPLWQNLARQSGLGLSVAWSQYAEGWLLYQRNELEAAADAFRRFGDLTWGAHGRSVVDGYTGLVLTALALERPDEASEHIRTLTERLLERGMLALARLAQSLEQRVALARGSPTALDWHPEIGAAGVPVELWEQPALTYVRTLLAAGGPDALAHASQLLASCRDDALARNSRRRLIEVGAFQALVLEGQGLHTGALDALQEAVEYAAPGGALRLLADCGPGLTPLLQQLQAAGVAPQYIERLMAALGERVAVDEGAASDRPAPNAPATQGLAPATPRQTTLIENLTNREIDVLVLLAERLSDKEIAERLVLSPVTVKKHLQRIYGKLDVHGRRAAVAEARRLGLI